MKRRRVIKRVSAPIEHGVSSVLQRAAEQLQMILDAEVVFASVVDSEGIVHCLGVAPAEKARLSPISLLDFPEKAAILDAGRLALFARSYHRSPGSAVVSVPVRGGDGLRAIVTAVVPATPENRLLRMLDAWAGLLGDSLDAEQVRRALELRSTTACRLREVLHAATSLTSEAVLAIDLDGRITRWNAGCERLYGWESAEVVGSTSPMIDENRRGAWLNQVREIASAGVLSRTGQSVHRTATGTLLLVDAAVLPLPDDDGDISGAVLVLRDETPGATACRDALSPALSEAALARLLAPVTAVSGFVQLLRRQDALTDPVVRANALRGLERRCREISEIADELKLATRLLDAEPRLKRMSEDPARLLRAALGRVVGPMGGRVFMQADEGLTVHADPDCLETTMACLLRGLMRCHAEDSSLSVSVVAENDGIALRFNASPSAGPGMADHPESALGIHLARLCAEAHGGEFGVCIERGETEIKMVMPSGTLAN